MCVYVCVCAHASVCVCARMCIHTVHMHASAYMGTGAEGHQRCSIFLKQDKRWL